MSPGCGVWASQQASVQVSSEPHISPAPGGILTIAIAVELGSSESGSKGFCLAVSRDFITQNIE